MSRVLSCALLAGALAACTYEVPLELVPVEGPDGLIHHTTAPVLGEVGDAGNLTHTFAVAFEGRAHVFAQRLADQTLAWCGDALDCDWQTIDGTGGDQGRVVGAVGDECIVATPWAGSLHVFYRLDAAGRRALRHGTYTNHRWRFETMLTPASTDGCASVLVTSRLMLATRDQGGRSFRLLNNDSYSWTFGAEFRDSEGFGHWSALAASATKQFVFYSDDATNAFVESVFGPTGWSHAARARFDAPLQSRPAAVTSGAAVHVFFQDPVLGDVVHGIDDGEWRTETIDGHADQLGQTTDVVGAFGVTATDELDVFYYDTTAGDLRHAQATDAGWRYERLDGETTDVGKSPTALEFDGGTLVIYEGQGGVVRRAWLAR